MVGTLPWPRRYASEVACVYVAKGWQSKRGALTDCGSGGTEEVLVRFALGERCVDTTCVEREHESVSFFESVPYDGGLEANYSISLDSIL